MLHSQKAHEGFDMNLFSAIEMSVAENQLSPHSSKQLISWVEDALLVCKAKVVAQPYPAAAYHIF